ncbi:MULTISPECIES: hypothetical protein [unclassified Streptomyces]|uniref:hypothetical protein n=1 Tax=unclassified Streptomyces TaxID=2593676 RepID=UPI0006AF6418|nr:MULTISPECIES: hypothetical protein [unclassified Streptomyces]KOX33037.1 hypothetical protein ADL06_09850 [Streptomyces sp. NRRL F-6491]KOX49537.1 hypothetical protein ADL08_08545 [Streptomyces sp. NRRL F-6492]
MVTVEKPLLVGSQEFAALYGVRGPQVSQWIGRGTLTYEQARIVSGSPYWPLAFARSFGESTPRRREVSEEVLERLVAEQMPARWVEDVAQFPPLVGQQEGAMLFGLAHAEVLTQQARPGKPAEPDWMLSGSPLWLLDTLLRAAPALQAQARTLAWEVDPSVEAALRDGSYDGPGAVIKKRGPAATKGRAG